MNTECKFRFATRHENHHCSAVLNPGEEKLLVPCGYASLNTKACPIARYAKGEITNLEMNQVLARMHINHRGTRTSQDRG